MTDTTNSFQPDWASSPGETILDLLEELNWTETRLADALGCTPVRIGH
jgi:HTH-type transcriptional regulator/antitoxin HigA